MLRLLFSTYEQIGSAPAVRRIPLPKNSSIRLIHFIRQIRFPMGLEHAGTPGVTDFTDNKLI